MVLGVTMLLFGGKKLPDVARGLGHGIRNFKSEMKSEPTEDASVPPEDPSAP